jgi:hypothetical protein
VPLRSSEPFLFVEALERVSPKVKLNFTNMQVSIPELDAHFQPLVWCPMMIKLKEQNQFPVVQSCEQSSIVAALNTPDFRWSLKEAYGGKSMQLTQFMPMAKHSAAIDDSGSDEGFSAEEYRVMESYLAQGYRIAHKDHHSSLYSLERPDEIVCRGKRPVHDNFRGTQSLNFGGRVKMSSKKNA